jgi:hypothetical protein
MKYTYNIQSQCLGNWHSFIRDEIKSYCDGYMDAMRGEMPRVYLRMVRSDGKIIRELPEYEDVGIGQIAGFPTPEQYERAAERALERARKIRERNDRTKIN